LCRCNTGTGFPRGPRIGLGACLFAAVACAAAAATYAGATRIGARHTTAATPAAAESHATAAPSADEFAALMDLRQANLAEEVESSPGYRVMPGVEALLERLTGEGRLVGLITGNTEPAARVKLARANLKVRARDEGPDAPYRFSRDVFLRLARG